MKENKSGRPAGRIVRAGIKGKSWMSENISERLWTHIGMGNAEGMTSISNCKCKYFYTQYKESYCIFWLTAKSCGISHFEEGIV